MSLTCVSDLPSVERFVSGVIVAEEEHVDEGDKETGSILWHEYSVGSPLIEDQND